MNTATATIAAIAYLESDTRLNDAYLWSAPCPMVALRGDFDPDVFADFDEQHAKYCDVSHDALCTGDGYRWHPTHPVLRFP